ncbi:phage tail protein [Pseudomonas sp. lyk4-R2A-10]|uniref:phage tail-collar fiber domain-containing protein n=1 Tax=Pseudomonas sp. lyk4-R2A-10 TaxID=3040315 RepID=UPI00255681E5|nr:phage tail protein [Pseudomonas sp. lyk4-R2A-10]
MVDQNSIFGGMMTTLGTAKKTNCDALGIPWEPRYMLIGDANGTDPVPSPTQTRLINQRYRAQLNQLRVSPTDENILIAELVLPPDVGGWWIRELALEDKDGVFSAVANVAPSYKPLLAQGSGRNQVVRMHVITSGTSNIQLKIDPSVVLATREFVDTRIREELYKLDSKQSVRVATTGNITLAGLPTIDGVALLAGDRVLVKNQAAAKDNGIFVAGGNGWVRAADADTNAEVTSALHVSVEQGATQADTRWQLITDGTIVVGTTPLTFQDVSDGFARTRSPVFLDNPTGPTPAQFDNSKSLATTEFVKRSGVVYSGFSSNAASLTLTAAHVGGLHSFSGLALITATLPPTATVEQSSTITLVCSGAGGLNVVAAGTDVVFTANGITGPLVMALGETAEFIRLSGQWRLIGGTLALRFANGFAAQLAANGYQRNPSGLIEQWGVIPAIPANSSVTVSYFMAFPNTALGFAAVGGASGAGVPGVNVTSVSATQIRFWNQSTSVPTQAGGYRVVGY